MEADIERDLNNVHKRLTQTIKENENYISYGVARQLLKILGELRSLIFFQNGRAGM